MDFLKINSRDWTVKLQFDYEGIEVFKHYNVTTDTKS